MIEEIFNFILMYQTGSKCYSKADIMTLISFLVMELIGIAHAFHPTPFYSILFYSVLFCSLYFFMETH
jgi:hypothetical protein